MVQRDAGYEILEHTADAAIRAWGHSPGEAFSQAAQGMFAIVLGADPSEWAAHQAESRRIEAHAEEWDDLLVNWLSELVFTFDTEGFVVQHAIFDTCAPSDCSSTVYGFTLGEDEQPGGVGIKAVTYHLLEVRV